jgi:inhibitor of KinA
MRIYPSGDHAITIELGERIDVAINQQVIGLQQRLLSLKMGFIKDIIPSYHTVTIVYDPLLVKKTAAHATVYAQMEDWLLQQATHHSSAIASNRQISIPVCYDPSMGWDLHSMAAAHGLSTEALIGLHTAISYRVYLIGFLPGFAYMGSVDQKIATPRKTSPRTLVPAGSVGIAGEQTGIYPFDSPGGWQLIGRTPWRLFDVHNETPCLLQAGDEVKFYPIDIDTFNQLSHHAHPHT